ncbi:MAG: integrase arm-type DNA-binding domain-containing protein, partial [Alphaproteobacteria bacterium]
MALHKLTARAVDALNDPGRYGDGGGLWLQVQKAKGGGVTKSWGFRYTQTMPDGRRRGVQIGLGALHTVTLADAREAARELRKMLHDGLDPKAEREKAKAKRREEAAKRVTFKTHAEAYIEAHKAGWKNAKHGAQWTATLEAYAYPVLGAMDVRDIETAHV